MIALPLVTASTGAFHASSLVETVEVAEVDGFYRFPSFKSCKAERCQRGYSAMKTMGSNRNSREMMPGEHLALPNNPSCLRAIGAERGGRGGGLRISPLEGEAHRADLKAECAACGGPSLPQFSNLCDREGKI